MKKRIFLPLLLLSILLLALSACAAPAEDESAAPAGEGAVTVVDIVGREKTIDYVPQRIAAISGPTYEMTFMLGGQDRVVMVKSGHTTNYPVALLTNPDLANYKGIAANPSSSINIEDFLQNDIDLVLYYDNDTELAKFDNAGIPSVVITVNTGLLDTLEEAQTQTIDEYIDTLTYPMSVLAALLQTEEASSEYETWRDYCSEKLHMIYDRTSALTDDQRKSVYWANTWGENVLSTYVLKNRYYEVKLAGGDLIGPDGVSGNFPEITREQLFTWDPEVILVDNHGGSPDLVVKDLYNNDTWSTLSAVQNQQIFRIPAGVFFLDKGSTTTLLVLWMATILQPELFADIDMVEEIKYYYSEFYEYDLTDEEAQKVIDGWVIQ
ncbi:MAG: ABC transporter substrate-binding protein [Firmicutes bacterium]|nr:ABC transporter substrate-binding protein [Bacillota bacterium]